MMEAEKVLGLLIGKEVFLSAEFGSVFVGLCGRLEKRSEAEIALLKRPYVLRDRHAHQTISFDAASVKHADSVLKVIELKGV